MNFPTMVACAVVGGAGIGFLIALLEWPTWTSYLFGGLWGFFVATQYGHAAAPYYRLRATTVHIAVGSGFVLEAPSKRKYLVTNWHVCNVGSWQGTMRGNFEDGRLIQGHITKNDPTVDLCASKVHRDLVGLKLSPLPLQRKEQVFTRGYPYGVLSQHAGVFTGANFWNYFFPIEEVGKCFKGSTEERDGSDRVVGCRARYHSNLTNLYSRPGSSGSPVVNTAGDLVGVMSSWDSDSDSGGMVRYEDVKEFIKDL